MALKRSADDAAAPPPRRQHAKRVKLSPSAEERSDSSAPSSCSVSESSALHSTPPASVHARNSSMSSLESAESDSDSDSESSISSDSGSSESDEELPTIGGPKKPNIQRVAEHAGSDDLRSRLATLLPQLEKANSLLASEGGMGSMEDVEEGEQYIEMNLGLGVLEEQGEDDDDGSDSSKSSESSDEDESADPPISSGATRRSPRGETGRMAKLTGRGAWQARGGIEEIG